MIDVSRATDCPVVVGIGEALFDCFLAHATLGGAPVNFVVHVQQLLASSGGRGVLVSRVGADALGDQLIRELEFRGIPVNLVQCDPQYPTGQVQVEISAAGDPEYDITENVAWDHLTFEDSLELLAASCDAVCFGTLAQRNLASRMTIYKFLAAAPQAIRLLDVNLRQRYATPEMLEASFRAANVVKLNQTELLSVSSMMPSHTGNAETIDERACALLQAFNLKLLALTRGSRGTVLYTKEERVEGEPVSLRASANADDVGAGDACGAGLVYGVLMRWPLDRTANLANRLGAFVASQPGGTPRFPQTLLDFATAQQV